MLANVNNINKEKTFELAIAVSNANLFKKTYILGKNVFDANIVDFSLVSSYIILNTMRIVNNISEQRMSRTAVVETIGLFKSIYNLSFKSCLRKCRHCT